VWGWHDARSRGFGHFRILNFCDALLRNRERTIRDYENGHPLHEVARVGQKPPAKQTLVQALAAEFNDGKSGIRRVAAGIIARQR
jgi:hypothetical protein